MYTTAEVNLTSTDIYPDLSTYKDSETNIPFSYSYFDKEHVVHKIKLTLYSIIFALGIIGNGLVIWIAGFRMKKTISAVWFLNLAIADFLCCASLPLRIADWVSLFLYIPLVYFVCLLSIILLNLNMSASVLLLVAISIDRCVSVMWPFWAKVHRTRKLVRITAGIIWVMSLLLTGLVFYLYVFYVDDINEWCVFYSKFGYGYIQERKLTIRLFRLFMMFVIPFLIILISYVIICRKLRKGKRSQRSQRSYRIITAVILCFFICWLPYYMWPLTPMYNEPADDFQFYAINTIIVNLACLNSCMNPIIYVFMSQNFKLGFFRSIPARVERALSEHPNDLCRKRGDFEHTDV